MCHFITGVLPAAADHLALDALAQPHGYCFRPQDNPSVEERLRPGERYFLVTAGYCDCGTSLGAALRGPSRHGLGNEAEQRRKLLLRGWGEAKIERWLEQRRGHQQARERNSAQWQARGDAQWRAFVDAVLQSRKTAYLGVLLHYYRGALSGRIQPAGREVVSAATMPPDFPGRVREDVLYEFRP